MKDIIKKHSILVMSVMHHWVYIKPDKITFKCIQKAIYAANKAPPLSKKIAWNNVYELSRQYQRQEDAEKK